MFTKDSNLLIKYISKKVPKTALFKEYCELFDEFDKVSYEKKLNEVKSFSEEYTSITKINDSFVSDDINQEIHKLNKFKQLILLTNKSKITINIHYSYENITKFVDIIVNALCFIFNLSIHNVYKCTINYYFTDNKKKLSLDKDYLNGYITNNEVNSGSCSSDTINIWRKEEILKVTLHECIHLLNYDLKNEDNFLKEHYRKRYNITSDKMNIFEAYTEIWAELINIYLIVKLQKGNKHLFSKYIGYETFFSTYQASKIFFITNLKDKPCDLNKETNVLPYFIIKCEFYNNLKDFLNHCKKEENNKNYVKIINNFKELIFKMSACEKNDKYFKKIDKKSFNYLTMRMSCLELELLV